MFDVGFGELVALGILALFIFGPDRLPQAASQAGKLMRELREMASGARRELGEHIDPELASLDPRSLDPRTHLRDVVLGDSGPSATGGRAPGSRSNGSSGSTRPRFDPDAT